MTTPPMGLVEAMQCFTDTMSAYHRHEALRRGLIPMVDTDPRPLRPRPNIVNSKGQRRRKDPRA